MPVTSIWPCQACRSRPQRHAGVHRRQRSHTRRLPAAVWLRGGPDHGAMGVHYINLSLFGDGEIDALAVGSEPWEGSLRR